MNAETVAKPPANGGARTVLISFEFSKLLLNKYVLWLTAVLFALNVYFVLNSAVRPSFAYSYSEIRQVYDDMRGFGSNAEKLNWLSDIYEKAELQSDDSPVYTGDMYFEKMLLRDVLDDVTQTVNYGEYLEEIDNKALVMGNSFLFSQPDTFAYRNAKITPLAYAHLKGLQLTPEISQGVQVASQSDVTDLLLVLFLFVVTMSLVFPEKEKKLFNLVKSTRNGHLQTIMSKFAVLFTACVFGVALFYGSNLLIGEGLYGLGDCSRSIQSVSGFLSSPYAISVSTCLVFIYLQKIAVCFIIAAIVLFISVKADTIGAVFALSSAIMGLSYALNATVDTTSRLGWVGSVNLVPLLRAAPFYNNYVNINLFEHPVNVWDANLVVFLPCFALFVFLAIRGFCGPSIRGKRRQHPIIRLPRKTPAYSLFSLEAHKHFILNKVLLVMLLFLALQVYSYSKMVYGADAEELHYRRYMDTLSGELTAEKEAFIQDERNTFREVSEQLNALSERLAQNQMTQAEFSAASGLFRGELIKSMAFDRVLLQYENIRAQEGSGNKPHFLYDTGILLLVGDRIDSGAFVLIVVLILCLYPLFGAEYSQNMVRLLHVGKNGKGRLFAVKMELAALTSIPLFLVAYLPSVLFVTNHYGTAGLSSPVCSIAQLTEYGSLSIVGYLSVVFLLRWFGFLFIAGLIIFCSLFIKKPAGIIVCSTVLALFPPIVHVSGWARLDFLPYVSLLDANTLMQYGKTSVFSVSAIAAAILSIIVIVSRVMYCRTLRSDL